MKKLCLLLIVIFAVLAFQACKNKVKDSEHGADSLNAAKDSATLHGVATQGISVTHDDAAFAVQAANGGMSEVAMGKMAQQLAANPRVKNFGTMMVDDHSKANDELKALAKSKNIVLPASVGKDEVKMENDLSKKKGKDFDKAYVDAMVDDHKKDIGDFQKAIKFMRDSDLKAFAVKTLPVLQKHLDSIKAIKAGMK